MEGRRSSAGSRLDPLSRPRSQLKFKFKPSEGGVNNLNDGDGTTEGRAQVRAAEGDAGFSAHPRRGPATARTGRVVAGGGRTTAHDSGLSRASKSNTPKGANGSRSEWREGEAARRRGSVLCSPSRQPRASADGAPNPLRTPPTSREKKVREEGEKRRKNGAKRAKKGGVRRAVGLPRLHLRVHPPARL